MNISWTLARVQLDRVDEQHSQRTEISSGLRETSFIKHAYHGSSLKLKSFLDIKRYKIKLFKTFKLFLLYKRFRIQIILCCQTWHIWEIKRFRVTTTFTSKFIVIVFATTSFQWHNIILINLLDIDVHNRFCCTMFFITNINIATPQNTNKLDVILEIWSFNCSSAISISFFYS